MLSPEYLDSLPDELAALLEELETWVISEIARRLSKEGGLTDTAAIQYSNVSSYFNAREINDRIAEVLEYTREQADVLFEEAMAHSIEQEAQRFILLRGNGMKVLLTLSKGSLKRIKGAWTTTY